MIFRMKFRAIIGVTVEAENETEAYTQTLALAERFEYGADITVMDGIIPTDSFPRVYSDPRKKIGSRPSDNSHTDYGITVQVDGSY